MQSNSRLSSGIVGLDEILYGGFIPERAYLIRGTSGTGKTTLGLHFLANGAAVGDPCLFLNLGETENQIRVNAANMGLNIDHVHFLDLSPSPNFFKEIQTYDIFYPSEVERQPTTDKITSGVENLKPRRIFIDAITYFRYISSDDLQYRRQVQSLLRFLTENGATVLFTSEDSVINPDNDLQFMSDGIIHIDNMSGERSLSVLKFRGSSFRGGHHAMRITGEGIKVYPRLLPQAYRQVFTKEILSSGVPELDEMLHGGIERSMISIISGPTGIGKTTFGIQFMKEAAGRGERSVIYTFEEWREVLMERSTGINIPVKAMIERGTLEVIQVDPLQYSPDEFAHLVRQDVEKNGTSIVMIDSVAGYRLSVRGDNLVGHLHALSKYLQNVGVMVLLINETESITGDFKATEAGISYLSDNMIFMRYVEVKGQLRRVVGVLKKRLSNFEKTMREYEITRYGIKVGAPIQLDKNILAPNENTLI